MGRLTLGGQLTYLNYSAAYNIDAANVDDLSRAEMECLEYIIELYHYLKNNMEGFENSEISFIAPELGIRDSRRIKGMYKLTREDIESSRKFEDAVALFIKV